MCECNKVDRWQECITRGNTEFSLSYYGNAILMYSQALDEAKYNCLELPIISHEKSISKVVISFFNLAECYIKLEQIERACELYSEAQSFLLRMNEETTVVSDSLNKAILHADSHINQVWVDFINKYRDEVGQERLVHYYQTSQTLKNETKHVVLH